MKSILLLVSFVFIAFSYCEESDANQIDHVDMKKFSPEEVKFRYLEINGIKMRLAEMGNGPLVLLAHGWPESWYSWRHQLVGLSKAGFRVIAPDMRGYGGTDAPSEVNQYDINHLTADMIGILDALGEKTASIVGHDWGAPVATYSALFYPERFTKLVIMSVPYNGRQDQNPIEGMKAVFQDNFFYILYHNEPDGVAEKEYDKDPRDLISKFYQSPGSQTKSPKITDPKRSAGGFLPRIGEPEGLPDWFTPKDLDYVVGQFEESGFRGGVNYYRNIERNWKLTKDLKDHKIKVPTLFIAGSRDMVIGGASKEMLQSSMKEAIPLLEEVILFPNIGHWVQQEAPEETNKILISFLNESN